MTKNEAVVILAVANDESVMDDYFQMSPALRTRIQDMLKRNGLIRNQEVGELGMESVPVPEAIVRARQVLGR